MNSRQATDYAIADLARDPDKPAHVAESFRLTQPRRDGEGDWIHQALERIPGGGYRFAGEPHPHGDQVPARRDVAAS